MRHTALSLVALSALVFVFVAAPGEARANPNMGGDRPAAVALTTSFELLALTVRPLKDVVPAQQAEPSEAAPAAAAAPAPPVQQRPAARRAGTIIEAGNGIDDNALARWGFWLVSILGALGFAASLADRSRRPRARAI